MIVAVKHLRRAGVRLRKIHFVRILGEQPVLGHYVGGGVLLMGITLGIFGGIGKREVSHEQLTPLNMTETSLTAERKAGFKGV